MRNEFTLNRKGDSTSHVFVVSRLGAESEMIDHPNNPPIVGWYRDENIECFQLGERGAIPGEYAEALGLPLLPDPSIMADLSADVGVAATDWALGEAGTVLIAVASGEEGSFKVSFYLVNGPVVQGEWKRAEPVSEKQIDDWLGTYTRGILEGQAIDNLKIRWEY